MDGLTSSRIAVTNPALAGTWKLDGGRAVALQPTGDGILRVAHGCLWATLDGPHQGAANDLGDQIVGSGESVRVHARQRLVIEAWDARRPAYFVWEPRAAVRRPSAALDSVAQPLGDLRAALGLAAGAAARLAVGLLRLGWELVAPRGRLADCALNAHSKACRAHGAMS